MLHNRNMRGVQLLLLMTQAVTQHEYTAVFTIRLCHNTLVSVDTSISLLAQHCDTNTIVIFSL